MNTNTMAIEIEKKLGPIAPQELVNLGAVRDTDGVWLFPDGSRGRLLDKPVPVYSDARMTRKVGLSFFDRID